MHDDLELTKEQEAMFQPGRFVALHPESNHPDAGRVGKIISRKGCDMIVEFFWALPEFKFNEAGFLPVEL